MGAFGLLGRTQDDHVPLVRMVEAHPVLDVHRLARQGALTPSPTRHEADNQGDGAYTRAGRPGAFLEIDGQRIEAGWHPSLRIRVFKCPDCSRNCYRLHHFAGHWNCRKCAGLDYSSRHLRRTVPGYTRAVYLRRRLARYGVSSELFAPIDPRPLSHRKFWRIVVELRRIEAGLACYLGADINDVLERRHARRRRRTDQA